MPTIAQCLKQHKTIDLWHVDIQNKEARQPILMVQQFLRRTKCYYAHSLDRQIYVQRIPYGIIVINDVYQRLCKK